MQFINILDKVAEIRALLGTICRNYGRTLTGTENTEIEIVVNQLYAEKGITSDVNSLFEKKGGRLDNGKYAIGRIPKKMPTLSDFQRKLKERERGAAAIIEMRQSLYQIIRGESHEESCKISEGKLGTVFGRLERCLPKYRRGKDPEDLRRDPPSQKSYCRKRRL